MEKKKNRTCYWCKNKFFQSEIVRVNARQCCKSCLTERKLCADCGSEHNKELWQGRCKKCTLAQNKKGYEYALQRIESQCNKFLTTLNCERCGGPNDSNLQFNQIGYGHNYLSVDPKPIIRFCKRCRGIASDLKTMEKHREYAGLVLKD
jgi:hypothetical protein